MSRTSTNMQGTRWLFLRVDSHNLMLFTTSLTLYLVCYQCGWQRNLLKAVGFYRFYLILIKQLKNLSINIYRAFKDKGQTML